MSSRLTLHILWRDFRTMKRAYRTAILVQQNVSSWFVTLPERLLIVPSPQELLVSWTRRRYILGHERPSESHDPRPRQQAGPSWKQQATRCTGRSHCAARTRRDKDSNCKDIRY